MPPQHHADMEAAKQELEEHARQVASADAAVTAVARVSGLGHNTCTWSQLCVLERLLQQRVSVSVLEGLLLPAARDSPGFHRH